MNSKDSVSRSYIALCFAVVLFFSFLDSCKNYTRNRAGASVSLSSIESGEESAKRYCQSCHLLPDPSLLDTKSWQAGVLPQMGPRLGIYQFGYETYPSLKHD